MRGVRNVLMLVLVVVASSCGRAGDKVQADGVGREPASQEADSTVFRAVIMRVPGMTCPLCVESIRSRLQEAGLPAIEIDLETKLVEARFDPRRTTPEQIRAMVEEQGFPVEALTLGKGG